MTLAAVVIPARLESSRLAEKMLLSETGYPLVVHTAARASEAAERSGGRISSVHVATDDERIAAAVRNHGFGVIRTSRRHPTGSDRLAEAAQNIAEDVIINLQGDEPEAPPQTVLAALEALLSAPQAHLATCAFPINEKEMQAPALVKVVTDAAGFALYFSRAPIPYRREDRTPVVADHTPVVVDHTPAPSPRALGHVGIYAYRKEALLAFPKLPAGRLEQTEALEQLRFLENGYRIKVALVSAAAKGIDTYEDYKEFVARWRQGGKNGP